MNFKMKLTIFKIYVFILMLDGTVGDVRSSLTFVIDDTGSMSGEITQVKEGVDAIFDTVMNSTASQIEDFVLVTFNDAIDYFKKPRWPQLRTKTRDREEFKKALRSIDVDDGGDCPEMSMAGIKLGLENSREGSSIYVVTDASARDYKDYDEIEALSQKMGSQIVFILTGDCVGRKSYDYLVYQKLADATGGEVFNLIKGDIGEILNYVRYNIESRKDLLANKTFPAGDHNTFDVSVDADIKELVISVKGLYPKVKVTDSKGAEMPTKDITRLKEIAVVKVEEVSPGVYTVEVGSKKETRVAVKASTTIHFQHGFSIIRPTNIRDTVTRPVPGQKSHLSIKLYTDGADAKMKLLSAQILDMADNVIRDTNLTLVDKAEQFYTSELIMPPDHMFKVAIIGYDVNTETLIKRISFTPVKPQEFKKAKTDNKAPVVDCREEVSGAYNKTLQIRCKVSGYPKPSVIWVSDDRSASFTHFEYTKELPYDYISILEIKKLAKNATYTLEAVNSEGSNKGSVAVRVKMDNFFKVIRAPHDATVEYRDSIEIPCQVEAYPNANISWYKGPYLHTLEPNDKMELSSNGSVLTIKSMEPNMADNYICEARNDVRRKVWKFSLNITGIEAPKIRKDITRITTEKHSGVDISCPITQGKPYPEIHWSYKDPVASEFVPLSEKTDTLHIDNADVINIGSYRCFVQNDVGWDSHEIDLVIEYEPRISRPLNPVMTVDQGEMVTLSCSAEGTPTPAVSWKLNGVPILSTGRHILFADGALRFAATTADEGDYECEARNSKGMDSINYKLYINVPVDIESPKQSYIEQMEGSRVTLPCRADGSPKPIISWVFRSNEAKVGPRRLEPTDATGTLTLDRIRLHQSGEYTCVATNIKGSKNITYEVSVLAPPKIYYKAKEFQGMEGDTQLVVPCGATGNPKPEIYWTIGDENIASGSMWFDVSAEGSLIMKNIYRSSAGFYTCKAKNKFGLAQERFSVAVIDSPNPGFTNEINLKTEDSSSIRCNVPHTKTDKIMWFKDGRRLVHSGSELPLYYVTESESGIYTCRVTSVDRPAQTSSTRVMVGSAPRFAYPDDEKEIGFVSGQVALMDCSAIGTPEPAVKWYHNGRRISLQEFKFELEMTNDYDKGRYVCEVSNDFGTVRQEFVVSAPGCLLDVLNDFNENEPLMLTSDNEVPNFKIIDGLMHIPKKQTIKFVCPSTFNVIRSKEITVTCEKDKQFVHAPSDRSYSYSDFKCRDKWLPVIKNTGKSCAFGRSELLEVVFEVRGKSQKVYEVCVDQDTQNPIYTKLDMQPSLSQIINNDIEWFDYKTHVDLDGLYDCNEQNLKTSRILNKNFHRSDGCCFAKRQLVDPLDLAPVLQSATYTSVNVAPHWGTCNSQNWQEVERRIRNLVTSANRTLQVYTGTALDLQLPDAYGRQANVILSSSVDYVKVPRYLWKVVQDPATMASLAIVQVNVPDLKLSEAPNYRHCKDVCGDVEWMQSNRWRNVHSGYTFCCSLSEFEKKFRYDIFPKYYNLMLGVSDIPDKHYLHPA